MKNIVQENFSEKNECMIYKIKGHIFARYKINRILKKNSIKMFFHS
jgi:hypothetical protein